MCSQICALHSLSLRKEPLVDIAEEAWQVPKPLPNSCARHCNLPVGSLCCYNVTDVYTHMKQQCSVFEIPM
jgi:hypothetical protein